MTVVSSRLPFASRMDDAQVASVLRHISESPVKLGPLAKALGLVVKISTLPQGKSGQISPSQEAPSGYMIKINRHESKERQRFTLAHEIAHFLLHKDKIGSGIFENILYRADGISNEEEVEANRLAAEILMPRDLIRSQLGNRVGNVDEETAERMAEAFQVSVPAMKIRLGLK